MPDSRGTGTTPDQYARYYEYIGETIKFIFSYIVLVAIAVIVSGKCLSQWLKLNVQENHFFKIHLWILRIEARNEEVVLGFAGFIVTLLPIGVMAGPAAYDIVRFRLGLEVNQFSSVCIISSFSTVLWSFFLFVYISAASKVKLPSDRKDQQEHERLIKELSSKANDGPGEYQERPEIAPHKESISPLLAKDGTDPESGMPHGENVTTAGVVTATNQAEAELRTPQPDEPSRAVETAERQPVDATGQPGPPPPEKTGVEPGGKAKPKKAKRTNDDKNNIS